MNFKAYIKIIRPINGVIIFLSVFVASIIISENTYNYYLILSSSFAAFFFASAGMVINDFFDLEIDKINRPTRPIASGEIKKSSAIIYYLILNLIGVIFNFSLPILTQLIGLVAVILIYFYSKNFKKMFLIGNFIVAFLTGLTFIYGASINEINRRLFFPFIFAFLITLSREILKTAEDFEGDKKNNLNTIAIKLGNENTIKIVKIILMLLMILDSLPYFVNYYSFNYFLAVNLTINFSILYILVILKNNNKSISLASQILKLSLFGGLFALWLK